MIRLRTLGTLLLLLLLGVPAFFFCFGAWVAGFLHPKTNRKSSGRNVLLNGGKMTKSLKLARLFKANGDRIIMAETPPYQFCGARFSNAVDDFYLIPKIAGDGAEFKQALAGISIAKNADLFVPVSSPKSAFYEAQAKPLFPKSTTVFQLDEEVIKKLDDKHQFVELARSFGLSVPESHEIKSFEQLKNHQFTAGKKFILKKLDYDPVYRMDLRQLPYDGWENWAENLPISKNDPWVLQEFIEGDEICTHTTTQNGKVNLYICCDSSPFQVNYAMREIPAVRDWVTTFINKIGVTGQLSFDFIITKTGEVMPIECNPRTHSAITLLHNQPQAAAAYYSDAPDYTFEPNQSAGHTYWLYHELYRLVTAGSISKIQKIQNRLLTGKEAVFDWRDPWPFFFQNHVGIPYQLYKALVAGMPWTRIDFNIGKLVIPGGD
jgi:hypothetical protein